MNNNNTFLGKLRRHRKLSQDDVAQSVGMSSNFVSLIENGKRGLSKDSTKKLARLLKVPEFAIQLFQQQPIEGNPEANEILAQIQKVTYEACVNS